MNIKYLLLAGLIAALSMAASAQNYRISSPDGSIGLEIAVDAAITWRVSVDGVPVIAPSPVSLMVNNKTLGENPRVRSTKENEVRQSITPVVPLKSATVEDHYNELYLAFKDRYAVVFRVYDDGVAYRFETSFKGEITVSGENAGVRLASDCRVYFPEEDSYISHYERIYKDTALSAISAERFCSLPVLLKTPEDVNVLITETDLFDYPNMFMYGTGSNALTAAFPKVVLETEPLARRPYREERIVKEADYIARTRGTRSFPWRVFVLTREDGDLVESNLVYQLSRPNQLKETGWIKPGKVAWDWWNANNIYGVDFRAGKNTETYKYYIDFAAAYGLEYIILDEGWSKTNIDLTASNPDLDLQELIRYGESRNVGIILWLLWKPLAKNMEPLLDTFAQWGAKGIKVDFMQRADQDMVNFYERTARECAKRQLVVDFHGAYKPAGLQRAYPNVLNFEGVRGLENNKWGNTITPDHNLTLPFIRMVAGPMDYTPGAMHNANRKNFRDIFDTPMSMGTRCHQVAMYVVYESPLQMLADNPTHYYKEPETTAFIARMPVTWDETRVLEAQVGDYILMARRKADKWYIGTMTDWTPREFTLDCSSFLGEGRYRIEIMQDGINADRNGNDYKKLVKTITGDSKLQLELAPGGGWSAIIEPAE